MVRFVNKWRSIRTIGFSGFWGAISIPYKTIRLINILTNPTEQVSENNLSIFSSPNLSKWIISSPNNPKSENLVFGKFGLDLNWLSIKNHKKHRPKSNSY